MIRHTKVTTSRFLLNPAVMDGYLLQAYEESCSVMATGFKATGKASNPQDKYYFVVGTALTLPNEDEPTKGRILVFSVQDNKLRLEAETSVRGAVYSINDFNGKILAGVNSKVCTSSAPINISGTIVQMDRSRGWYP